MADLTEVDLSTADLSQRQLSMINFDRADRRGHRWTGRSWWTVSSGWPDFHERDWLARQSFAATSKTRIFSIELESGGHRKL